MAAYSLQGPSRTGFVLLLLCTCIPFPAPASGSDGGALHVKSGESIQAAINAAYSGQMIVVELGTYAEQLTINTDGLQLVGKGASLVPPGAVVRNTCTGLAGPDTEAGICVTGQDVTLADFVLDHRQVLSVGQPVKDILVTGFQIQGFGLDVAVVGGQNTTIVGNGLYDGGQYGCLSTGSNNSHVDTNNVTSTGGLRYIGICMDDMTPGQITNNSIEGYNFALCVQTDGAHVANNHVLESCFGAFVDPGVQGAKVLDNHVGGASLMCASLPGEAMGGITIFAASDTEVQGNVVEGMRAGGLVNATAGITLVDDPTTNSTATGNKVVGNTLLDNDLDIYVRTAGAGNVVKDNKCSTPAELCG
ncbi:uncharacterized protein PV07_06454 [Cladophialophora immunda]|uniref:Uncharacterized protein n=1 Tax=Cladophialophora immunda TaxID=569365 RepID=A0A0D2C830_9EURO|nr:uncharacterized protein PV07_06454 [Cladophialophora immunda]KIW26635.1 hypothetical protein PV07_06454 [Cladophialophora immunda]